MAENLKNIATAKAKSLKTSPQKANIVLKSIRGKKAENAINILSFSRKRISNEILKVLKSAIANAENNHQLDIDKLFVKEATVGKAMVLKRFRPRARGRSGKLLKPFSSIKILVQEMNLDDKNNKINQENNSKQINQANINKETTQDSKIKDTNQTNTNKEINKDVKSKETDQNKKTEVLTKDVNINTKKIGEKNGTKD